VGDVKSCYADIYHNVAVAVHLRSQNYEVANHTHVVSAFVYRHLTVILTDVMIGRVDDVVALTIDGVGSA
jgi:hypothetical protein